MMSVAKSMSLRCAACVAKTVGLGVERERERGERERERERNAGRISSLKI
jgi:hypothetical protein